MPSGPQSTTSYKFSFPNKGNKSHVTSVAHTDASEDCAYRYPGEGNKQLEAEGSYVGQKEQTIVFAAGSWVLPADSTITQKKHRL